MKLLLEKHRDLNILVASGPITAENFAVLRAGIRKLFTDGKNKIILDLPDSNGFTAEILRELAVMNLIAAELSGQLVLSSIEPLTRAKIDSFSKPPIVRCFKTREDAIHFFYPEEKKVAPPPVAASVAPSSAPSPAASPVSDEKAAEQKQQFKADIRAKELGDVGSLRKRISELEEQNKELMVQLSTLVLTRRDPPDLASWQEKVSLLEKQLEETLGQQNAKDAPKK